MSKHRTAAAITAALFVGAAVPTVGADATSWITGARIKDGTVSGADVRDGSIGLADLSPAARTALRGLSGDRGATGADGPRGPQGPAGRDGSSSARGATGAQGPAGPAGPAGSSSTTTYRLAWSIPPTVYCNDDETATGGGWQSLGWDIDRVSFAFIEKPGYNAPLYDINGRPNGWQVGPDGHYDLNYSVGRVYVICAKNVAP